MQSAPVKNTNSPDETKITGLKKPEMDKYYSSVSAKFRIAKYLSVVALTAFMIFSFVFLRRDITIENLRYLLKFISFTNTETSISAAEIKYSSGSPNRLALFIGDLCTLTPDGYSLYDSRGNQILSESVKYSSPLLKVSERFALCTDMGGNSFTVLNTFTKLYEGSTDYPITDAAIADDGSFAIASSTREYRTAITIYNEDFKAISRVLKNDHLMGMELSADGKQLAIMTAGVKDGSFYTKVELMTPGKASADMSRELEGLGYSFYFNADGFTVITDEAVHFFDKSLNPKRVWRHSAQLMMSDSSDKYLTVIYSDGVMGNSYLAKVYDNLGTEVYEGGFVGKLVGVDHADSGDYIFILTGTTLSRINLINKKLGSINVKSEAIDLLVSDKDTALAAYVTSAVTYSLADMQEHYYDRSVGDKTEGNSEVDTSSQTEANTETTPTEPESKDVELPTE